MNAAELAEVLRLHRMWRRGEIGGSRANLAGADLTRADLAGADLAGANLAGKEGAELEKLHGPERAGKMIYRASTGRAPYFFDSTDRALADIKACAATQVDQRKA